MSRRLGRPAYAVFDDRGLLYLRMGEPDVVAAHGGGECIEPNVTWAYDRPGGYKLYHLSPSGGTDDWWLMPNLADAYRCGGDWDRNPFVDVPPMLTDIPATAFHDLYVSRMGLDPAYARIGLHGATTGLTQRLGDLAEEREWTWADGRYAVAEVPERPRVNLRLGLNLEWLQFQSRRPGRTRVWLNGIVDAEGLDGERLADGRRRFRVDAVWTVLGDDADFYERISAPVVLEVADEPEPSRRHLSIRIPADLPPGSYVTLWAVTDANDPSGGGRPPSGGYMQETLSVRDLVGRTPILSDVAVAPDSGGSWSPGGRVFLKATPAHTTGSDAVAFIYFEAYNLTAGGEYETRVRLQPEGGGSPFDLRYPGTAATGVRIVTRRALRVDLSETQPGDYEMSVTVRDLTTGLTTLPFRVPLRVEPVSSR